MHPYLQVILWAAGIVVLFIILMAWNNHKWKKAQKNRIKRIFGKIPEREYSPDDLERISHYSKEGAYVQTQTTSKRSRNFKRLDGDTEKEKNDLQAYVDAIDAKVAAGERLPGNETLTNSTLEASYLIIERLNKLLTDVQRQKAQCIKQLAELRNMSGGGKSELVDDWVAAIQAAEGMDDDTP